MTNISTEDFLAHYGVKGMRWGVRKEEAPTVKVSKTEDTKLTAGESASLGFLGVSVVGTAGLVAGPKVAAPLYLPAINKDLKTIQKFTSTIDTGKDFAKDIANTDISKGTVFHRVASYKEVEVNAPKYATYLQDDVLRYRDTWITPGRNILNRHYVTKLTATKDVTIASPDTIFKTLLKAVEDGSDDGKAIVAKLKRHVDFDISNGPYEKVGAVSAKELVDAIVDHNRSNVWADDIGKLTSKIMQNSGFSAVTDINNTGSHSRKHAVIILDRTAFEVRSRLLTPFERSAANITRNKIAARAAKAVIKTI